MKLHSLIKSILGLGLFVIAFALQLETIKAAPTIINFDNQAAGNIGGSTYQDLLITSNLTPGATIYRVNNPNCSGVAYPSPPNALYVLSGQQGGNATLNIAFTNSRVSDQVSLYISNYTLAGAISVQAFDVNGVLVDQKGVGSVANSCLNSLITLSKNSSAGIALIRIFGAPSGDGSWGIDELQFDLSPAAPPVVGVSSCQGSPAAPRNDISWEPVPGAQTYTVYRDGQILFPAMPAASPRSVSDTSPTAGTTYTYGVRTIGLNGIDSTQNISLLTTTCGVPPAPSQLPSVTIVSGTSSCSSFVNNGMPENFIQWDQNSSANSYILTRNGQVLLANIPPPNFFVRVGWMGVFDEAPTPGITYTYGVRPVYSDGVGGLSEITIATKPACSPPPPPPSTSPATPVLNVTIGCSGINSENILIWNSTGIAYLLYKDSAFMTGVMEPGPLEYHDPTAANIQSSYTIKAMNLFGLSPISPPVTVKGKDCKLPPSVSVISKTIYKASGSTGCIANAPDQFLKRNKSYTYCVSVVLNNGQAIPAFLPRGSRSTKDYAEITDWSVTNLDLGTMTSSTIGQLSTDKSKHGASGSIVVRFKLYVDGLFVSNDSATLAIAINDPSLLSVLGDIFGGGSDVKGLNVGPNSVVSSSGTISLLGRENSGQNIQNYSPSYKLSWEAIQRDAPVAISKLISEQGQTPPWISTNDGGLNYHVNSAPIVLSSGNANPEGSVWHIPNNLIIDDPVAFGGRGTIIVDGNVTINSAVSYQDPSVDMLGIISIGGNISFQSSIPDTTVVGAYFVPKGSISFGSNIGSATGLFVGNTISIDPSLTNLSIIYDGRITKNPLPGFGQSFVPSLGETTP